MSTYLDKTFSGNGNGKKWTFSAWLKSVDIYDEDHIFSAYINAGDSDFIRFDSNRRMSIKIGGNIVLTTSRKYQDKNSWYHIVVAFDSTQATGTNRLKVYTNGVEETAFAADTRSSQIAQNTSYYFGWGIKHTVGARAHDVGDSPFRGNMTHINFTDGYVYTPTNFGQTNTQTGEWSTKGTTGVTYGTNGFYFKFENSGNLGLDSSGAGNNFTTNNLGDIPQSTDVPSNNFPILITAQDPQSARVVLGNAALDAQFNGNGSTSARLMGNMPICSIPVSKGKWYCEARLSRSATEAFVGITNVSYNRDTSEQDTYCAVYTNSGQIYYDDGSSETQSTYGSGFSSNDYIGIALDADNKRVYWSKNGQWADGSGNFDESSPNAYQQYTDNFINYESADRESVVFAFFGAGSSTTPRFSVNFGCPMDGSPSGSNDDANGHGNFQYAVPSGYYALCTKNLNTYG